MSIVKTLGDAEFEDMLGSIQEDGIYDEACTPGALLAFRTGRQNALQRIDRLIRERAWAAEQTAIQETSSSLKAVWYAVAYELQELAKDIKGDPTEATKS